MKRVLVTGADGFLGQNLVTYLLDCGKQVVAVVYPGNDVYKDIKNDSLQVVSADLNNAFDYVNEFPTGIDVMYHLAWMGVRPEQRNDLDIQMKNLNMSMECFKLAKEIGVKRIILPGSTNEYLYYGKPINRDAIPSPSNAYGTVKVALRYLGRQFAKANDMGFIYLIVAGIYAADRKDSNVIFYTIDKLLHGEKPSLTLLEQKWDYIYIDDVIRAFVLAGEKGKNEAVYAVGHGDNWELNNYIEIIHNMIDANLPLGLGEIPYDSEVLPSSCIDLTDIQKDTGFEPVVDFKTGISMVIDKLKREMEAT